jgi:hypothetical protein
MKKNNERMSFNFWGDLSNPYDAFMAEIGVRPVHDMNSRLEDCPHYSDSRFNKPQTIFGKEEKGLGYDYSDRIWQWNYDKADQATKHANTKQTPHTANWYQEYLSFYFDKPVILKHILAGVNVSSGYPYLVFGYKFEE